MATERTVPWLVSLVLVAGVALPAAAQSTEAQPNMSGVWRFNPKRSDDLREKIFDSVGSGYTEGSAKSEIVRVYIHNWLIGVLDNPDAALLTIEQTSTEFKSGVGDQVSIYYFGREAASRGPRGGTLRVTVQWQGDQILTEERQTKGDGKITALYSLLPDGKNLVLAWRLEHSSLRKPLDVRMIFDRQPQP
jgi:hypothetical protein